VFLIILLLWVSHNITQVKLNNAGTKPALYGSPDSRVRSLHSRVSVDSWVPSSPALHPHTTSALPATVSLWNQVTVDCISVSLWTRQRRLQLPICCWEWYVCISISKELAASNSSLVRSLLCCLKTEAKYSPKYWYQYTNPQAVLCQKARSLVYSAVTASNLTRH